MSSAAEKRQRKADHERARGIDPTLVPLGSKDVDMKQASSTSSKDMIKARQAEYFKTQVQEQKKKKETFAPLTWVHPYGDSFLAIIALQQAISMVNQYRDRCQLASQKEGSKAFEMTRTNESSANVVLIRLTEDRH